jgi:hypothetical protein
MSEDILITKIKVEKKDGWGYYTRINEEGFLVVVRGGHRGKPINDTGEKCTCSEGVTDGVRFDSNKNEETK